MKKYFYFNGCSQTAGAEIVPDASNMSQDETKKLTWPNELTKLINPDGIIINDAENGGSNDRIFRSIIEWIDKNPEKLKDTFMVIMWTEPNRFEFELLNNFRFNAICGAAGRNAEERYLIDFVTTHYVNTQLNEFKNLHYMYAIETILKFHSIEFLFVNAFNFKLYYKCDILKNTPLIKTENAERNIRLLNDELCFKDILEKGGFKSNNSLHFTKPAHDYYANFLYDWMVNEKII